jgi:hypothetical protein
VSDPLVLTAGALCAIAAAIVVGWLINRVRQRRVAAAERENVVPLVVFAPRAGVPGESMPARPFSGPAPAHDFAPPGHASPGHAPPSYAPAAAYSHPSREHGANGNGSNGGSGAGDMRPELIEGRTVRFYRPPEGTLQMLPGRLEIIEGEDRGQMIRFVRMRSGAQQITFGRREGSPYEHVQLRALTVSRQHARLEFGQGHWTIENLSETNPVVVNGETLDIVHGARPLSDGDRIEMGEVIFRFKER